ncbi:transcriptional regulator [Paraburkholderia caffeinilytica]|uniref:Transcriptional regulator n=1 Tax=Paraburkholderia caffeinilytica TaxID=1761016 RepID=A0ABQ1NA71_9BURK|nr:transcriptional regulator [Paraburkholderia caffeinilytica]CAB3798063.1 hypothetical protein LMG28690_04653 [Paraburkholderia caffeinilytica]
MNNDLLFAIATDDRMLRRNLEESLAGDGIVVKSFSCELDLLRAMRANRYDLVLIDSKTESTATSAILSWRSFNADICTPLIVLTNKSSWASLLRWIDTGATDVVNWYDMEQVRFRAHLALQRSASNSTTHEIQIGRYLLQKNPGRATIDGVEIPLTAREFAIAWLFFSNPGKFFSRAQIAAASGRRRADCCAYARAAHLQAARSAHDGQVTVDNSRTATTSAMT